MANKGAFLTTDKFLATDDYLSSPNNLFFAKMQNDGNFVVYKGTSPNDQGVVWATDKLDPFGQFFAEIQDDGSFGIYKGTDPDNNYGAIWVTNKSDPIDKVEVSKIEYDLDFAQELRSEIRELYSETAHNNSNEVQTVTISGSESVSEQSGWSNSLTTKVEVKTTFETGIPFVLNGRIETSASVQDTYVWNGSKSKTKTWSFTVPMKVPPHKTASAFISVHLSTIVVPYMLEGIFTLKSGTRMPGKIKGIYKGTNSYGLEVTYLTDRINTKELCITKEPVLSS